MSMPRYDATAPHKCWAAGCQKLVDARLLMCAQHWYMVPTSLRNTIWRLFNRGEAGEPDHVAACRQAREAVSKKTGIPTTEA